MQDEGSVCEGRLAGDAISTPKGSLRLTRSRGQADADSRTEQGARAAGGGLAVAGWASIEMQRVRLAM